MYEKNDTLFPPDLEKIGYSILHHDLSIFKSEYRKNIIIDDKKLILFCVESSAYSIVSYLLENKKEEYNKLNSEEKKSFYVLLFESDYCKFKGKNVVNIFLYINKNFKISKSLSQSIMLSSLRYGFFDVYKILEKKHLLTRKSVASLLSYMKVDKFCSKKNKFYKDIFLKQIKKSNGSINKLRYYFHLLTLNLGGLKDEDNLGFEILIYNSLSDEIKEKWKNYLFSNENLMFYTFNISPDSKKKDGYDKINLNMDFIFFLAQIILSKNRLLMDDELNKINLLRKELNSNDLIMILNYNAFATLNSIIEKNILERRLTKKEVINKKTIIKI